MKNTLLLFILLFTSCGKQTSNDAQSELNKELKLEIFVNNFIKNHPNWANNDLTKEEANKEFKKNITTELNNGILDDFPLEVGEINEYSKGKYAVHFKGWGFGSDLEYDSLLYNTNFDLIGLMSKEDAIKLTEGQKYLIKGKFKKFAIDNFQNYINGAVYTPLIGLSKMDEKTKVSIGIFIMNITEVNPANK